MESNNNLGPNEVLVLINYPEGYEGKRHHKDGETYPMSIETANLLVKKGIATIQGDSIVDDKIDEAESEINQIIAAPELTMVKHVVTEEDLVNNPEMVDQGIQVGDEILIPSDAPKETPVVDSKKAKKSATKPGK